MKPAIDERETIIRIGRTDSLAEIYTTDDRYMTKLDKLVKTSDEWTYKGCETSQGDVVSKTYLCPVNLISFRSRTQKMELTEEQKEQRREQLRRIKNKTISLSVSSAEET